MNSVISKPQTQNFEELKKLVVAALETSGELGKIKAQLRAQVLSVIKEEKEGKKKLQSSLNPNITSSSGQIALEFILDFLKYTQLSSTSGVLLNEANCEKLKVNRETLASQFNLPLLTSNQTQQPLLSLLLQNILESKTKPPQNSQQKGLWGKEYLAESKDEADINSEVTTSDNSGGFYDDDFEHTEVI